jgi:acyl transferase domain-containing protein/NAD(P)-dependent dehydrogenase (short-subunit alcohol dehydrogenase family)/acyl carrier protein
MDIWRQLTQSYQLVGSEQITLHDKPSTTDYLHLLIKEDVSLLNNNHNPAAIVYEINISNQLIVDQLWTAIEQFFAKGGTRIAITLDDAHSTWQQQAQFIYHLLEAINTNYCELLLIDFGPNLFSGLLFGAITAFACESQRIKLSRVTAKDTAVFAVLPALFEQCLFALPSQQYHFNNQVLTHSQWRPVNLNPTQSKSFSGNVLITGGSGAVGQLLAHHLYQNHGCQVFLIGRKPLNSELAATLKQIKAKSYFQADCTSLEEMQAIYQYINEHYGVVNHVFHLAGSLNDSLFINKSLNQYVETIAVKIAGAQVLTLLAEQYQPKSVCLFSSVSGVLGNSGQTDYSAANACLNELAQRNNLKNQTHWFAINWGLWETTSGMQMDDTAMMSAMRPEDALRQLDAIYANNLTVATVYQGKAELLKPEEKLQNQTDSAEISLVNARKRIKEVISECTKIKNIDADTSLLEKGVDSIIATHIAVHIEKELSKFGVLCKIPKTLVFQHSTVNQIFDYLLTHHADALLSVFPGESKPITAPILNSSPVEDDRFAIIAAAGEFPEALDLHELWELLNSGTNAVKPIPKERWDWQQQFSLDANEQGKSYCRHGGFIKEAALFDAGYFKITPRDAQKMIPEARRLLHQSYYALEQCNFLKTHEGSVGVFVANMYAHYQNLNKEHELFDSSLSAMANHVSYAFNFNGPSMGIDSMCSGGLNALHVGLNSLKLNDCDAVLIGAANIMSHPGKYRFLSENKFLSPSGKCQSFGIGADGYVPGEGCVILIIKRFKDAVAAGDKILGIIRGSAVNSNGANSAMTVPSAKAQAQVIKKALDRSGLQVEDISYVEAHGTGTSLGDPIEIDGLNQVYGRNSKGIALGSLKSNLGHLEAAAGLASIVKVLLQMHYKMKVPSLHCDIENPLLDLDKTPFIVQKKLIPWGDANQTLYAGVSVFGAGGANAHVILESPPLEYAYSQIPRAIKKLDGSQAFWLEPQTSQPKVVIPAQAGIHSSELNSTKLRVGKGCSLDEAKRNPGSEARIPGLRFASSRLQSFRTLNSMPIGSDPGPTMDLHLRGDDTMVWLTKEFEPCDSPLSKSEAKDGAYFLIVTLQQKQVLETVGTAQSLILLHEATAVLAQEHSQQKMIVFNLTALDETEDSSYLLDQFNLAQSLTNKKLNLDLITVSGLSHLSPSSAYRASFDGLYRTLSLENPSINSLVIQSDESLTQLVSLLKNAQIKKNSAGTYQWLGSHWNKQKFIENNELIHQQHSPLLKKGGVYVISGGLGALGQIICKRLLSHYDATVICLGRSPLVGVKQELFTKLHSINAKFEYYQVDVTHAVKVQETIRTVLQKNGKLDGVINSACVLNDGLLSEKSFAVFSEVVKSKIQGTMSLDEATKECPLDFFVSFSSMSAVYSNVGQSDYCMANTFVDYFTDYREQLVKKSQRFGRSLSINWPLWDVEGLSLSPQTIAFLCEATGIEPLNEDQGAKLFERLMDSKHPCQLVPLYGNPSDIRSKLLEQKLAPTHAPEHSLERVVSIVVECISQVTHINKSILSSETSINELGMSSVLLAELSGLIEERLGTPIAPSAFFSYNTVEKIAHYLNPKIVHAVQESSSTAATQTLVANDEYAIVGLSALLPGGPEPEAFWNELLNNQSAVRRVTRWQGDYFAATLDNIKQFDNQFFNLSHKEAMLMDPQHRLFLQESYQALLNAGYPPSTMKQVGVFAGVQFNDYQNLLSRNKVPQHAYMATGNSHSMLANRVSYLFDFNGPSQTIDTACSSTLVAINRGILALKNNECELALCGAVSLLIDASVTDAAKSMGVLSPNFRCATFDESADGYVRGEGVGVFVIKRLNDALRDGDAIHAVIAASAENHGGRANSLTAPNPIAQKELLLKAYKGTLAQQVSYIETHGTGTRLGDPIEIDALTQAFKQLLPDGSKNPILLGSVKTNVGHLEPAAGVASMIKVIYALKHKVLPANVHFNQLNPYINLANTPFKIVDSNTPWDREARVAGISSFGFGGSYAHLVLKEAPALMSSAKTQSEFYIPLSARKPELLQAMKTQLLSFLKQEKDLSLEALSYMLCCCREHFTHRFIAQCTSIEELMAHLENRNKAKEDLVARSYYEGKEINWDQYFPIKPNKHFIPGYVFEQKEFWFDTHGAESVAELEDDK